MRIPAAILIARGWRIPPVLVPCWIPGRRGLLFSSGFLRVVLHFFFQLSADVIDLRIQRVDHSVPVRIPENDTLLIFQALTLSFQTLQAVEQGNGPGRAVELRCHRLFPRESSYA